MQLPITIGLHRSRFIDIVIGVLAILASLAILVFPHFAFVQAAILFLIWGLAARAWRQCAPMFSALLLGRDGEVSVTCNGAAEFVQAELLPAMTVHPWLCVFRVKTEAGRVYPLILAVDSLATNDFRRLRVFLRWRADFSGQGDGV